MDMDDDDAFLYGDDSGAQETSNPGNTQVTEQKPKVEETCSYRSVPMHEACPFLTLEQPHH